MDVYAYDLLLDSKAFPPGWAVDPCDPHCTRAERPGQSLRTFTNHATLTPGHVIQEVLYFHSEEAASERFRVHRGLNMARGINRIPSIEFLPPPQITYRSPIADEQYLACGVDVVPACRAGRRYERFFVEFFFSLDGWLWIGFGPEVTGMQIEEVEPILRAMDELVVEQLEMSPSLLEQTAAVPVETPFPLAPTPPSTLAGLIQALSDDDPRARTDAAYALETLGADVDAAIPALINNLNYEGELRYEGSRIVDEIDVRFSAVHALSVIGPLARDAIPELVQLIQHDPSNREDFDSLNKGDELVPLRVAAIRTLVEIGDSSVIPELVEVFDDIWGQVSGEAALAIGQLSGNDFSVDVNYEPMYSEDRIPIPVVRAREWWEKEGKYQDWETQ